MVVSTLQLHLYQEIYRSSRQLPFFRLVLKRVWHDIRDSRNGGHCLLTVGGRLRRIKIGAKCVKNAWLTCPARSSRWVLCISMQWLRLKGCHVACDECASGEICSHQHMWVTGLSYGQSTASGASLKFGVQGASLLTDFRELTACEITGFDCTYASNNDTASS